MSRMEITKVREREGISVSELARRIGTDAANVRRLERGKHTPRWDTAVAIASALGASLDDFRSAHDPEPTTRLDGRGPSQNQQPDQGASGANRSPGPAPHGG